MKKHIIGFCRNAVRFCIGASRISISGQAGEDFALTQRVGFGTESTGLALKRQLDAQR